MIKAVFFDVDNTLVDALECHKIANIEAFRFFGLDYEKALRLTRDHDFFGIRMRDILIELMKVIGVSETKVSIDELMAKREGIFIKLAQQGMIYLLPGAKAAVIEAKRSFEVVGIVSSATQAFVNLVLRKFSLRRYIDFVVDAQDVEHGKPAPDCYNKAYARLTQTKEARREECLVVEDAVNGVRAAKAAGMKVLLVASRPNQVAEVKPDWELTSLEQFEARLFV